jgi:hypothetical protein
MDQKTVSRGLGPAGKRLVAGVFAEVRAAHFTRTLDLDASRADSLHAAAMLRDRVADLEATLKRDGLLVESRTGVQKIHPAAVERRQTELVIARLLSYVKRR